MEITAVQARSAANKYIEVRAELIKNVSALQLRNIYASVAANPERGYIDIPVANANFHTLTTLQTSGYMISYPRTSADADTYMSEELVRIEW